MLVAIDRALKVFLLPVLNTGETYTLIPNILGLTYVENTGAGFGLFQGRTTELSIMTFIVILVMLYFLFFLSKKFHILLKIALVLIIAGGLGNLYDRVFNQFVFDYLEFLFFRFPIFNFADCLVTVGAVLFCVAILFFDDKKQDLQKEADDNTTEKIEQQDQPQSIETEKHDNA